MESRGQLGTNSLSQQSPPFGAVLLLASSCVPSVLENVVGTRRGRSCRTAVRDDLQDGLHGSCSTVAPLYEMSHC